MGPKSEDKDKSSSVKILFKLSNYQTPQVEVKVSKKVEAEVSIKTKVRAREPYDFY